MVAMRSGCEAGYYHQLPFFQSLSAFRACDDLRLPRHGISASGYEPSQDDLIGSEHFSMIKGMNDRLC